jgi:hypothetical protein
MKPQNKKSIHIQDALPEPMILCRFYCNDKIADIEIPVSRYKAILADLKEKYPGMTTREQRVDKSDLTTAVVQ